MNTYPFIGKFQSAVEMFFNHGRSVVIESGHGTGRHESKFKNITTEYLANTYGEVKSKEHAEFIKLLAETNDMPCAVLSIDMNYKFFYVIEGCLFFCVKDIDAVGDYKKITIPLPPESKDDDSLKNNGDNLIFGDADKCKGQVPESDYNELLKRFDHMCDLHGQLSTITQLLMYDGVDVEKLLNIGTGGYNMPYSKDYMDWRKHTITALTNVINIGESKCKEWPCVNDEVETDDGDSGILLINKPDDHGMVVVECKNKDYGKFYRTTPLKGLSKPKTPEQELFESFWKEVGLFMNQSNLNKKIFESAFINNITKKPQ